MSTPRFQAKLPREAGGSGAGRRSRSSTYPQAGAQPAAAGDRSRRPHHGQTMRAISLASATAASFFGSARQKSQQRRRSAAGPGPAGSPGGAEHDKPGAGPRRPRRLIRPGRRGPRSSSLRGVMPIDVRKTPVPNEALSGRGTFSAKLTALDRPDAGDRRQDRPSYPAGAKSSAAPRSSSAGVHPLELLGQQARHLARQIRHTLLAATRRCSSASCRGPFGAVTPNSAAYVDGPRLARAVRCSLGRIGSVAVICPALERGRLTAGPDGLRGTGPKQERDVDASTGSTGCPDPRIDRLPSCCSCACPPEMPKLCRRVRQSVL